MQKDSIDRYIQMELPKDPVVVEAINVIIRRDPKLSSMVKRLDFIEVLMHTLLAKELVLKEGRWLLVLKNEKLVGKNYSHRIYSPFWL